MQVNRLTLTSENGFSRGSLKHGMIVLGCNGDYTLVPLRFIQFLRMRLSLV